MAWEIFTCGPLVTAARKTTATVTVMLRQCGPFPSTVRSTTVKMPTTMKAVRPRWLVRSATARRTRTPVWLLQIYTANARLHIRALAQLRQRQPVFSH